MINGKKARDIRAASGNWRATSLQAVKLMISSPDFFLANAHDTRLLRVADLVNSSQW